MLSVKNKAILPFLKSLAGAENEFDPRKFRALSIR